MAAAAPPGGSVWRSSAYAGRSSTARLELALRVWHLIRVSLASLALALACKSSVGSSCDKGDGRCLDPKSELICQAGKLIETPCAGPRGCSVNEKGTSCDFSANKPGDPCSTDDEGVAICTGKDAMIACHGGAYAHVPCRGTRGCLDAEGRALCDTSLAEPGDVCHDENLKACSSDGAQVLICKQSTMQRFYACRGEGGCAVTAGKLTCDTSIAKLGDACDKKLEGQAFSCAPDRAAILICKGGAFTLDQACKSGQKCAVVGTSTQCARPTK